MLVLRGEAGVGKTALLDYLSAHAAGCRIERADGDESEIELAFAGVQQLCAPMLGHLDRLPVPQRDALSTAFGLTAGEPPDRFLVGLAVLSLLAEIAEEQPLICLIDDAHWLDRVSAQTLVFVGRRLLAESVALVFAARPDTEAGGLRGLREMSIGGLKNADAQALLSDELHAPLDVAVRERIVAETHGNPLALLELPRGLTPSELAGGFGLPDSRPLASRIEEGFIRQLEPLPAETRRLLLLAALEPIGDVTLLWRAADELGIPASAAAAAEAAGLIEIRARARFRHPLVRSAVCRAARPQALRDAHRALADATDPLLDPDRRAWHLAHALVGFDENVAVELERSANRAQARGGVAAVAAFLERAVELTPDPARRAQRALAAAQAQQRAGAPGAALELLAAAESAQLDELHNARADLLRAQIASASRRDTESPPLLLAAARRLERLDPALARDTYLDALSAGLIIARLSPAVEGVAEAAGAAPSATKSPRAQDLLLDGLASLITDGYDAGAPLLRRALSTFLSRDISTEDGLRWSWLAGRAAMALWDDNAWHLLVSRHGQLAREVGALGELPLALNSRVFVHLLGGELAAASSLVAEVETVTEVTGSNFVRYGALGLAAWRGQAGETDALIEAIIGKVVSRGEGIGVTVTQWARAVLCNGLGRYNDALVAARQAREYPPELGFSTWSLVELIEAGTRSGRPDVAADALSQLTDTTRASGTDWALGIEARCRALLDDGDAADAGYRNAIERLGRTRIQVELARTHLLYGEWLRRTNRRLDAREQLRFAHVRFSTMGTEAFAERTRRELLATGETVRKRGVETRDDLTAQEAQIAQLASDGQTNPEIGAQLFLSPRTVEWHLRKVFTKLDITSRRELRVTLPRAARASIPA